MPSPSQHRVFLPACLILGTLLYLRPVFPASADAPTAPSVNTSHWQKVLLNHVSPVDILATQHWDRRSDLPAGVTNVFGLQSTNSLLVQATPAGLAKLQEIVTLLDITPRPVQISLVLAQATASDLMALPISETFTPNPAEPKMMLGYAAGKEVAQLAKTLRFQGEVLQSSRVFAFSSKEAGIGLAGDQPISSLPEFDSFTCAVTPRINSDGSLTLALHPKAAWHTAGKTNLDGTPAITTQELKVLRTLRSGETLVIANLFPDAVDTGGDQLLLFVTPTILPTENRQPLVPGK